MFASLKTVMFALHCSDHVPIKNLQTSQHVIGA